MAVKKKNPPVWRSDWGKPIRAAQTAGMDTGDGRGAVGVDAETITHRARSSFAVPADTGQACGDAQCSAGDLLSKEVPEEASQRSGDLWRMDFRTGV